MTMAEINLLSLLTRDGWNHVFRLFKLPVDNDQMEEEHPLSLLTRDAWNHVFDRLNQPVDRWAAANVHPLFRSIFESDRKQEWMLTRFCLSLPHVCRYLDKMTIFKLQKVNRTVQLTVDKLLEDYHKVAYEREDNKFHLTRYVSPNWPKYSLKSILEQKCAMPRAKLVDYSQMDRFQDFGKNIHTLYFTTIVSLNPLEQVVLIRWILERTPNLKKLKLAETVDSDEALVELCETSRVHWAESNQLWAEELDRFWQNNPLAGLPKLETLHLCFSPLKMNSTHNNQFLKATIEALTLAYGAQLQDFTLLYNPITLPASMPLLQYLKVEVYSLGDLARVEALQAPLKLISVVITKDCQFTPTQLFQTLETFQETLIELYLKSQCWTFGKNVDEFKGQVEMPLLKKLKLVGCFYSTGLHFLMNFKFNLPRIIEVAFYRLPDVQENNQSLEPVRDMWIMKIIRSENAKAAQKSIFRRILNALCCCACSEKA